MLFHDSQRSDEFANVCLSVLDRLKPTLNGLPLRQKAVVRRRTSTTYSSVVPAKLSIEELVEIYPKGALVFVLQP